MSAAEHESAAAAPPAVAPSVADGSVQDEPMAVEEPQKWGRLLICGGTDWPKLGRKDKGGKKQDSDPDHPELPSPHVLRSLATVRAVSVHTSCASSHVIVIALDGSAYLFGRNVPPALGATTGHSKAWGAVDEREPIRLVASQLEGAAEGEGFVYAACGRGHSILVTTVGRVYSVGANTQGQCGHPPQAELSSWTPVPGPWANETGAIVDPVIQASAGTTFSLVLTRSGKVYSFGSSEAGQLGNGKTGERIVSAGKVAFDIEWSPSRVRGLLDGKKVVQIASGPGHSIVLDDEGFVYVFGAAGYCRLGLGNQQDVTSPKLVPQFAGTHPSTRGKFVAAGPTCSAVIDGQGMYWLAGKWKTSGDGSAGQPYSTFRYLQDITSCKMEKAACGGVTLFACCPDDEEEGKVMTVGWGQNAASSELGLGEGEPKSATKPQRIEPLRGIDVFDIAAGAHTTYFIAKPNDALSELTRHPADIETPAFCVVCNQDQGGADVLECEKCEDPYHLPCLGLTGLPEGEWFCKTCLTNEAASNAKFKPKPKPIPAASPIKEDDDAEGDDGSGPRRGLKRKAAEKPQPEYLEDDEDDDFDELDEDDDERPKRKRSQKRGNGATPKRRK